MTNASGDTKSNTSGGNKNSAHANQKAREVAQQRYEKSKADYDAAKSKPNKTPEEKKLLDKLEKTMKNKKWTILVKIIAEKQATKLWKNIQ